jgi:NADH-quinone oxidoreductase subunit J
MEPVTLIFFGLIALLIIASALGMLFSRNTVYSALFLVLNFVGVAVLYLTLGAPFIALAQVTVYAGAIMVLFLFVIMMLGAEYLPNNEPLYAQRPLAVILAVVFLTLIGLAVVLRGGTLAPLPAVPANSGDPAQLGAMLFSQYSLPFEVTSLILLVALVGAIVLVRMDKKEAVRPERKE